MFRRQRFWFLVVVLLASFGMAACGAAGGAPALGPGGRIFAQAQRKGLNDATFTTTFLADGQHNAASGTTTTQPRRMQLTINLTVEGHAEVLHILGDGDTLFSRLNSDTLWSILNDADAGVYANYDTDIVNYDQMQPQAVQLIGTETLGGVATWHIRAPFTMPINAPDGALVPVPGTEDLWLRQSDSLPAQIMKAASKDYTADDGSHDQLVFTATYHFTAWNTGLTITPPGEGQIASSG
jgi:hypothetical protein